MTAETGHVGFHAPVQEPNHVAPPDRREARGEHTPRRNVQLDG